MDCYYLAQSNMFGLLFFGSTLAILKVWISRAVYLFFVSNIESNVADCWNIENLVNVVFYFI